MVDALSISDCWEWFSAGGAAMLSLFVTSMALRVKWEAIKAAFRVIGE